MVSIIIPIYNSAKYLRECLESVCNQTYTELEILLVNDGSTDDSGVMCKEFANRDNRIQYYYKTNNGVASARNYGLSKATGEWIAFVDSDDCIDLTMIEKLLSVANNGYLMACCGIALSKNELQSSISPYIQVISQHDACSSLLSWGQIGDYPVNKLYSRTLFDNIEYPVGSYYEDIGTTYKLISKCNDIIFVNEKLYYYRQVNDSIVHSGNEKKAVDYYNRTIERNCCIENNFPDLKSQCRINELAILIICYSWIVKKGESNSLEYAYRNRIVELIHSGVKVVSIKNYIRAFLIVYFPKAFRFLIRII